MHMSGQASLHLPPYGIPLSHEAKHLPCRCQVVLANIVTMMAFNQPLPDGYRPSDDGSHAVFTEPIEASMNDDRSYKLILLPNEMEILLVHDANTDKSAAAMDVHVGNLTDPVSMPVFIRLFLDPILGDHCRGRQGSLLTYENRWSTFEVGQPPRLGSLLRALAVHGHGQVPAGKWV